MVTPEFATSSGPTESACPQQENGCRAERDQLCGAAGERSGTRSIFSQSKSVPLPLSVSQTWLWNVSRLAPDSPAYNELVRIRKTGLLDVQALSRALTEVVARHEAFRTTFRTVGGVPYQFLRQPEKVALPLTDLSDLSAEDAVQRATEIAVADTLRPYDLADGPLLRPRLMRIADEDHWLYLGLHHLIVDETTLHRVVFPELTALYRSYVDGQPSSLPDPPAQYADYVRWELDWVGRPAMTSRIAKWRRRLANNAPTQLPLDHPRLPRQPFAGGTIPLTIEHTTVEGLGRAARAAGGTLFHALAAAYAWWLHLYTDCTKVIFGSFHDLRPRDDLSSVAGYCVTPVILQCDVSGEEPFITLIGRIRAVVSEALSDVVPFDTLLAALDVPRHPRAHPLFQTSLLFQPSLTSPADDWSLHLMEAHVRDAVGSAKFDISIELEERSEGHVAGGLVFNTEVFERDTAREMAVLWSRLLDVVVAAPEIPLAEHDLVIPDERRRQLSWNQTTQHGISLQCVHEIFRSQVERTPEAVAVQVGNATLTYRQLDDYAAVIEARLVQAGAGPGMVVAVMLERTCDLVAAILGVLKSGAAFLPLDPRQPAARNTFCINDADAKLVLSDCDAPKIGDALTVVNVGLLKREAPRPDTRLSTVSSVDLAYVIYTSGSTGRPKGVLVEHRGITNLMRTMFREFGVGASDTVLSVASISFDLALCDIFCALGCGARLVLATAAQATDPAALSRLIADSGATYMMATPATWGALVTAGWRGDRRLTAASVGETLTEGLADALLQRCGSVWNGYGTTEASAGTSVARLSEGDTVTVGRPLPNVRVYILDGRGRLQPVGVPGEIAIGGVAVARGYLNCPEEHARRFTEDPFHAGDRIYRTGDRGRFLPGGRIQHLGRYDGQLKIRGFRIEPGEIESILREHPGVECCAVVPYEAGNGERQLVAYIVGKPDSPTDAEARDWLRRRLPEYMVPSVFMHLNALPTTVSGKLDKAALPAPSPRGTSRIGGQSPRNDTERRVAGLWADLLAKPVTDVHSDFFDMGGNSLLAARLLSEVQRAFGVGLTHTAFVDNGRTVAELAELVCAESPSRTDEGTSGAPLHFIFSDLTSAMSVRHLTAQWGAAKPVHALIPEQPGGRFDRSVTIQQHASQALSAISNHQPDGALALAGYSFGGLLAYEVAGQAVHAGRQVDWLGILDAPAPPIAHLLREQLTLRWQLRRLRRRPARERRAKYAEVALRVLRGGPGALWPQNEFDYRGAAEVACRYQRPGHEVPMHLFVSEVSAADMEAELLGWDKFHKGTLTVHRLAADHVSLLDLPEVEHLSRIMLESLWQARVSTRVAYPVATLREGGAK